MRRCFKQAIICENSAKSTLIVRYSLNYDVFSIVCNILRRKAVLLLTKKITGNRRMKLVDAHTLYENLLFAYFSMEKDAIQLLYSDNIDSIMERFLDIFVNEDIQKGTNHAKLIQLIYSNPEILNKNDFVKGLNISYSTLQRYRDRYSNTLKIVIDRFLKTAK